MRIFCLVAVLVIVAGCAESETALPERERQAVPVRTHTVTAGSWSLSFKSYGMVRPSQEFEIGVEVSATVEEVLFREGDSVAAGDILMRLDDKKLRLRRDGARAGVEEARAAHEQAKTSHQRNEAIYESGVISEQAFLTSEAQFKSSQANLRRALSSLDIAEEELADTQVRSPVDGKVTRRAVEPGQNVSPAARLGTISVTNALRIEAFVSQKEINHISIGQPVQVTSPGVPGQVFEGRVDQVASTAEENTGNFEVGVVVQGAGGQLRDGMSAMVEFQGMTSEAVLAVPRDALVDRNRKPIVYRLDGEIAREVEPQLGIGDANMVPVYSGLSGGDEIVVSNLRLVRDGQPVQVNTTPPEA